MLAVSRDNDWSGWCAFFLKVVQVQAEGNLAKAQAILELYNRMKIRFPELTHSQYAIHALDWVFERPDNDQDKDDHHRNAAVTHHIHCPKAKKDAQKERIF